MAISQKLINAIEGLKNGDESCFSIIYEETHNYVYSKSRLIMKDEESALDLTQETYIQAYKNISSLQNPDNIFAWLGAIAYRQGMKIYRKDNEVLLDEEASDMFEQIEDSNIDWNPELSADEKETGNIIAGIIDELPPLQKAALTAFYFDEMKIDQIADMYDCSPNTIKSRLNYAKKYVKECIEEKEKKEGFKLHSVSGLPLLLFLGLRQMLAGEKYTLSSEGAASLFGSICKSLNISVSASSLSSTSSLAEKEPVGALKASNTSVSTAMNSAVSKAGGATLISAKTGAIIGGISAGVLAIGLGVSFATGILPIDSHKNTSSISAEISSAIEAPVAIDISTSVSNETNNENTSIEPSSSSIDDIVYEEPIEPIEPIESVEPVEPADSELQNTTLESSDTCTADETDNIVVEEAEGPTESDNTIIEEVPEVSDPVISESIPEEIVPPAEVIEQEPTTPEVSSQPAEDSVDDNPFSDNPFDEDPFGEGSEPEIEDIIIEDGD